MQGNTFQIQYEDNFLKGVEEKLLSEEKDHWAVGVIQIKNFYLYQDMYGRVGTNNIINKFEERLRLFQKTDGFPVSYFGQDNFYILFPNDIKVVQSIYDAFLEILPYKPTDELQFYPIMGICSFDNIAGNDVDALAVCNYAKVASAKANEKDEYIRLFSKKAVKEMVEVQHDIEDIRRGIANKEFIFYLQPKVNSTTNTIVGMEALMRWDHPKKGIIGPNAFIPIAEGTSLVKDLDLCVWEGVCKTLARWKKEKRNIVPISINVSQEDINHMAVADKLIELVDKYEINPSWISVEITETAVVNNTSYIKRLLKDLHKKGIKVGMDDFGAGASSLDMLKDVSVDTVKLDMKLIQFDQDNLDRGVMILSSVVNMIHKLNVPIIAEGVETKEQVAMLQSINCKYIQGFYYYKPMSVESIEKIMARPGVPLYFDIQADYLTSSQLYGTKFINTELYQALRMFNMYTDYFISMGILNLKTGEYALVKHNSEAYENYNDQIVDYEQYCQMLLDKEIIHPEYVNVFKANTNIEYLKNRFYYERKGVTFNILEKRNHEYVWLRSTLIPCKDCSSKNPWCFNVVTYGEDNSNEITKATQYDYTIDALTKVFNRNKYEYDIKKFHNCFFKSLVCTYIDVIGLHQINYYEGHEAGDRMLQVLAQEISKEFEQSFVYRVGGDEYVILSPNSTLQQQKSKIAKLEKKLAKQKYYFSHGTSYSEDMSDIHSIINAAEDAMRVSKKKYYNDTEKNEERARLLNDELENALEENKTMRMFLNAVRREYYGIYLVNIKENKVKCLTTKESEKKLVGTDYINFRNVMNYFILNYVDEKDTFKLRRLADPVYLESEFKKNDYIKTIFNTQDKRVFDVIVVPVEEDDKYTIWCFNEIEQS